MQRRRKILYTSHSWEIVAAAEAQHQNIPCMTLGMPQTVVAEPGAVVLFSPVGKLEDYRLDAVRELTLTCAKFWRMARNRALLYCKFSWSRAWRYSSVP